MSSSNVCGVAFGVFDVGRSSFASLLVLRVSVVWPVANRHSQSNEQLHTSGLLARRSRCRRSNGKWAASSVCKWLPRIDISTKFGLPWNSFNGSSVNTGFSSNVITCKNVLSTNALRKIRTEEWKYELIWANNANGIERFGKVSIFHKLRISCPPTGKLI